jgi:dTDP-4-dehydrorhamnose reductase
MRVLVLGADGHLGHELCGALGCFATVVRAARAEVDLTDLDAVRGAIATHAPDVLLNAASYNDVDHAEQEPEVAMRVNAEAVAVMGEQAARRRFALVHYSSDFVFDGTKPTPYVETDAPAPINAYARSKLAGERALEDLHAPALVLRTAWVYGLRRKSFVSTMLHLARERADLRVVADQVGSPTFCRDLAHATSLIVFGVRSDPCRAFHSARGVYHLAGSGSASRYELAIAAMELDPRKWEHKVRRVEPVPAAEFALPAARPLTTALDCAKIEERFGVRLPPWRDGLRRALAPRFFDRAPIA